MIAFVTTTTATIAAATITTTSFTATAFSAARLKRCELGVNLRQIASRDIGLLSRLCCLVAIL
jgi:hypothetical protein